MNRDSPHFHNRDIEIVSPTLPQELLEDILSQTEPLVKESHLLYPSDNLEPCYHLPSFFYLSKMLNHPDAVSFIVTDLTRWIKSNHITIDAIFAPAESAVRRIAESLQTSLNKPAAFLECLPSGRFGESIENVQLIAPGKSILVFNGVSTTGRCVGMRLPSFVEKYHANVSAISAFAKGDSQGVLDAEEKYGKRFYSGVRVRLPLYPADPKTCALCLKGIPLRPWNKNKGDRSC